jgi:hypothetical protein
MPLAALDKDSRGRYIQTPAKDLESLLYTVLAIVTFTTGPCGRMREPTDHVPIARWYNEIDREQLYKDKTIDLIKYKKEIEKHLPDYWKPFSPYLHRLILASWPGSNLVSDNVESVATHQMFREILQEALREFATNVTLKETLCNYARKVTPKRLRSSGGTGSYPYKFARGDVTGSKRLPQLAVIKPFSQWIDSVDLGSGEGVPA